MSEIQYETETKRGWRIILLDESGTDILHGYSRDKAEKHAKKIIDRYNAFEDGGIVDELRTACEEAQKAIMLLYECNKEVEIALGSGIQLKKAEELLEAALAKS